MKGKLYDIIEGADVLTIKNDTRTPLVEGMLFPQDYVILVAEEKVGKTIFAQQLASCMTTGKPFLDIFDIPKPLKVWYIATEGRSEDLKDRFIRMNNAIKVDTKNIKLIPTFFRFNTAEGVMCLNEIMKAYIETPPDVVIVDALYRAIKGSIKDDNVVNDFHHVIGTMVKNLGCAVILVHHMTKPVRAQDGSIVARTDKDSFGSAFLAAAVDHLFWIEKWKDKDYPKDRVLKCDTQRGGKIIDSIRIRLVEPDPLYFEVVDKHEKEKHRVVELIKAYKDIDIDTIVKKGAIGRSVAYQILKELFDTNIIDKKGTRRDGIKYSIKPEKL